MNNPVVVFLTIKNLLLILWAEGSLFCSENWCRVHFFTAEFLICWMSKANDQRLYRLGGASWCPSSSAHCLSPDYKLLDEALGSELLNSGVSVNTGGNQI
jgi:hypothetical protein